MKPGVDDTGNRVSPRRPGFLLRLGRLRSSVIVLLALVVLQSLPDAQAVPTVTEVYGAFTAGDPEAIYRRFRDAGDLRGARGELLQFVRASEADWRPSRAAFLIHVIHVGAAVGWTDMPQLLTSARDMVVRRTARVGANTDEDAFEIQWHRTGLAILMGSQDFALAQAYLTAIGPRLSAEPVMDHSRLYEPRLPLMQALVVDLTLAPIGGQLLQRPELVPSLLLDPRNPGLKARGERALASYAEAVDASVAPEAGVRSGFLLHRLGRHTEARDRLRAVVPPTGDVPIAYLRSLFLGRVEEALGHPAEAVTAYEAAAALVPGAQTPAVALTSLHQRQDRPREAARWAAMATAMPLDRVDPWWRFWAGDYWRVPGWLADLRGMRP